MPEQNTAVLDFLRTRRSRSPKTLQAPAPNREEIESLLTVGARVPDHKMLVPWRYEIYRGPALERMADAARARASALGKTDGDIQKAGNVFANAPLIIGAIYTPKGFELVPEVEQILAVGGVCLSLVNAALASGWGAGWVTGWMAFDTIFCKETCGLAEGEFFAGFVHVGTETLVPQDRARPDLKAITRWVDQ